MIYCFDLDNTLCITYDKKYDESLPNIEMIDRVNHLYKEGHMIVIHTARGMGTFSGNLHKVYQEHFVRTKKQLESWGVMFHDLVLGKPSYDFFIDDKNLKIDEFTKKILPKRGFIAGSFDCIHPGYIKMFQEAKKYCDYLVIGLHEDPTLERPSKIKPLLSVKDRVDILNSIKYIDEVCVYATEEDLKKMLLEKNITIRYLGDDYIDRNYTGYDLNIPVIFLDRSHGWPTTQYKKMISEQCKNYF